MSEANSTSIAFKGESLVGRRFGRWLVLGHSHRVGERNFWDCICDCGTRRAVQAGNLRRGVSRSCGCYKAEMTVKTHTTHGASVGGGTVEFNIWMGIIKRCENLQAENYENYGGRGIRVCERWRNSFAAFLADMGQRPSPAHSIDRYPDNDGNYEPGNCRWATRSQQRRNSRHTRPVTWRGRTMLLRDWARELGMYESTLHRRIAKWGVDRAFETPLARRQTT